MAAIQIISARVGRTTGRGIAGNVVRTYPTWVVIAITTPLLIANTINIGANLGAMADALALLVGGSVFLYVALFSVSCVGMQILLKYRRYVAALKWLALALMSYIGTLLFVDIEWGSLLWGLVVPQMSLNADYLAIVVAILGTTISPYLFFWQASQEAEDLKEKPTKEPLVVAPAQARAANSRIQWDTMVGMGFSNLVALSILISAAATLHKSGVTDIQSSADAAKALEPIAGGFAMVLFAAGIIGTGLLAVPVLAGSAAYAVGESLHWPVGLGRRPREAKAFYATIAVATLVGVLVHFAPISPIRALFWSAVLNGVVAVPVMGILMVLATSSAVMGPHVIDMRLRILGWTTFAVMLVADGVLIVTAAWG